MPGRLHPDPNAKFTRAKPPGSVVLDGQPVATRDGTELLEASDKENLLLLQLKGGNAFGHRHRLQLVVSCTQPTTVDIEVNDGHYASAAVAAGGEGTSMEFVTVSPVRDGSDAGDPTLLPEGAGRYAVRVSFRWQGGANHVRVLLAKGKDAPGSGIVDVQDAGYTRAARTFQVALYGLWMAALVLWFLSQKTELVKGLAPSAISLAYGIGTTFYPRDGVQDWSPAGVMRRLWSRSTARWWRLLLACSTSTSAAAAAIACIGMSYALWMKNQHVSEIAAVLDNTEVGYRGLAVALARMPWRREVFLAYEARSRDLKHGPEKIEQWRRLVREIVESSEFCRVADSLGGPDYQTQFLQALLLAGGTRARAYQDPALTLAYILPEAESDHDTHYKRKAVDLLHKHRPRDCRATLLRLYIEHDLAELAEKGGPAWPRSSTDVRGELRKELGRYTRECKDASETQEYLAALDKIALEDLETAARTRTDDDIERAMNSVSKVMEIAARRASTGHRIFWRSPGKLSVYVMWRYLVKYDGRATEDPVYGPYYPRYAPILTATPDLTQRLKARLERTKELAEIKDWTQGTSLSLTLPEFVREELAKDWHL